MDFFKSVFPTPSPSPPSTPTSQNAETAPPPPAPWALGSTLFRTIATKSESLLDNYYKDFQEFSSGLKKETSVIREAASRAVQDLPARLDSGAAIAQESLEAVGQAIDNVGSTVSGIINKDLSFVSGFDEFEEEGAGESGKDSSFSGGNANAKPYSRIEAMIRSVQCDVKTYCEGVEESGYEEWRTGFRIDERREEIEKVFQENGVVKEIFDEVVPVKVDEETFWCRYFYRVDKVVKAEEARVRIVKRAILAEEEEELSWDVDDDDDNGWENGSVSKDKFENEVEESGKRVENLRVGSGEKGTEAGVSGTKGDDMENEESLEEGSKVEEKAGSEGKIESDFSVISSQRSSHVGEDFGWDEIEDIGSADPSKIADQVSHRLVNKVDLHKRLNAAEDDEDLTWDIEDDDQP